MLYEPIGLFSKTAYHIPELSASIHSFEELCYIVKEKTYDIDDFIMEDELIIYIRDNLAIAELADMLSRAKPDLIRFTKTLLSYRHHMSDEDIAGVCSALKDGSNEKEYTRLIARGDFFAGKGQYRPAILLYEHAEEILNEENETEGLTYRELMLKMGKLYAVYYMFERAAECFSIAGDERRTYFCRKLSLSRVEYADMLLKEHPDEKLSSLIEEMTREPADIAALRLNLREDRSYGRDLALQRLSEKLKAEYRRTS